MPDWAEPAELADRHQSRFDEHHGLTDLLADRREAFVAIQVLGMSYAEAAEVCDCPVGTIRSRAARAREDLVTEPHR